MSRKTDDKRSRSTSSSASSMLDSMSSLKSSMKSSGRSAHSADMSSDDGNLPADRFSSLGEVSAAIRSEGVDKCGLIFGIDYTLSNKFQGEKTFDGLSLHDTSRPAANPYQKVICIMGETLETFDDDGIIPAYGFGDARVKDKSVFPLKKEGECYGFSEVLDVYNEITPHIKLGGPTNFAPLIEEAINIVQKTKQYHILVICADGQVTSEEQTEQAIVEASDYPLSIIMIGLGDGPWDVMHEYDNKLPARKFDNFRFVDFNKEMGHGRNPQTAFALSALMEIPDQYNEIMRLKLLSSLQ